jgi:hypothetical protein
MSYYSTAHQSLAIDGLLRGRDPNATTSMVWVCVGHVFEMWGLLALHITGALFLLSTACSFLLFSCSCFFLVFFGKWAATIVWLDGFDFLYLFSLYQLLIHRFWKHSIHRTDASLLLWWLDSYHLLSISLFLSN